MQPEQLDSVRVDASRPRSAALRWRAIWMLVALLLLAGYALPLFMPPAAAVPAPPPPDATLSDRLFPGVPGWWVAARLLCLFCGAALAGYAAGKAPPLMRISTDAAANPPPEPAQRRRWSWSHWELAATDNALWLAVGTAGVQAVAGLFAAHFNRTLQLTYLAWFALPTLILIAGTWRNRPRAAARRDWGTVAAVCALVTVWLLLRWTDAWRSPRASDALDAWKGFLQLTAAADPHFNLLTEPPWPGASPLYMVLQGAGILELVGIAPSLASVQAATFLWLVLAATAIAWVAFRLISPAAAPVAVAAFLFAPAVLMMPLNPSAFFLGALFTAVLLALLLAVHLQRSAAALAGLGAVAGLAVTHPVTVLIALVVITMAGWSAVRRPGIPRRVLATAALSFLAGVVLVLPSLATLQGMTQAYARGRGLWVGHEQAGFGQVSPTLSGYAPDAGAPGPIDAPLSAFLAPFATPRTPSRLLGDTLFEPTATALLAIGIAVCVCALRTHWAARVLLAVLCAAIVPACAASTDRISFVRLMALPVPLALLAAVGFESLRRVVVPRLRPVWAASVATLIIALGGLVLFDRVNPGILPSASTGIVLRAIGGGALQKTAVLLDHPRPDNFPTWYLNQMAEYLHPRDTRVTVRVYDGPDSLGDDAGVELFTWNPGLEEDAQVANAICQRWPGAALYTLVDRAGLSRAFAARPAGPGWTPNLGAPQWKVEGCAATLETEATRAAAASARADALAAAGRPVEATAVLRAAAVASLAQVNVFKQLATWQARSDDTRARHEAVHWALRACYATQFRDPMTLAVLAASYAANEDFAEAQRVARKAQEVASARGDHRLADEMTRRAEGYTRRESLPLEPDR